MKLLRDREGATSVLVIFMMIVLVVFATLAFTTSYANYTLSKRSALVTQENYALDALAMRMTFRVDGCLAAAETRAQEAMVSDALLSGHIEGLTRVAPDHAFLAELMNRLYLQYALEELTSLNEEFVGLDILLSETYADGDWMDLTRPAPDGESLRVAMALTTGGDKGDKQLDVVLGVRPLEYDLRATDDGVSGARAEGFLVRYRVDAWKQWQIPHEYDDGIEFGDARIVIENLN